MSTNFYLQYLDAKQTVDDRALNQQVWQTMTDCWRQIPAPRHLLEIGCGAGGMAARFAQRGLLEETVYLGIDHDPTLISEARRRLPAFMPPSTTQIAFETVELCDFLVRQSALTQWEMIMAHAFLDLIDVERTLPKLFKLLPPGGCFYFTLNFDGETILEPEIDPEFDRHILRLYHQTMDDRLIHSCAAGDSKTGRHLFAQIQRAGGEILNAGSSDWVVYPQNARYLGEEATFLTHIIHTLSTALTDHSQLDQQRFSDWIAARKRQIQQGKLIYIAHQLDFFGRIKRHVDD